MMKKGAGCGNPHCYNKGQRLTVGCKHKCGFVMYCSQNCQKQHWLTGHQFDCPLQSSFTPNNILSEREWLLFERTPYVKQGELLPVSKLPLKKLKITDFEAIHPEQQKSIATQLGQKMVAQGGGSLLSRLGDKKRTFLGQGSYGSVELVRYRKTGQLFAMKRLEKNSFANKMQRRSLLQEVEIHKRLVHDNIIRLYHSFEDETFIYLVRTEILEYASNGTLFHLIRRRKKLTEDDAFYYFIQACSGIYFLHENNMIHRDIKPQNLLIDSNDKVKLCDFGWCVVNQDTTTRSTYCGTLEYMAPQMLHNGEHNHTLDLWAMGVLLYELLHGHAPFTGRAHLEIKKKIMRKEVVYRDGLSDDVKDLISSLLQHEAKHRLPLMKVLIHPWVMKMSQKFHLIQPNLLDSLEQPKKQNIADFYEMPPKKKELLAASLLQNDGKSSLSSRAPHTSSLLGSTEEKTPSAKGNDNLELRELVTDRGAAVCDEEMEEIREMKRNERKLSDAQDKCQNLENGGEDQGDLKMLRDMRQKDNSKRKIKDFLVKGPLAEVQEEEEQKTQASTRSRTSQQISNFLNDKEDEEGEIIGLLKEAIPRSQREDDLDKMCKDMEDQVHIFQQLRKSKMNSKPPDMLAKKAQKPFSPFSSQIQESIKFIPADDAPPIQSSQSEEEIKDNQPPSLLELMQGTRGGPEEDNQPIQRTQTYDKLPSHFFKKRDQRSLDPKSQRSKKLKKGGTANLTFDNLGLELDLTCQRGRGMGSNKKEGLNHSVEENKKEPKSREQRALERLSKDIRSKGTSGKHLLYEDAAYKAKWLKKLDPQTHLEQDYLPRKYIYGHKDYDQSTKQMLEAIEANEAEFTIFKSDYDKLPPDEQFRLRNQKPKKGGFWESLWKKMSNPFGCGSTSRKEDGVSAK